MSAQLLGEEYRRRGIPPIQLATNIGNSAINLAGLVPWAVASSVPLTTMEVGVGALPLSVYLFLVPLCHGLALRRSDRRRAVG